LDGTECRAMVREIDIDKIRTKLHQ
jgi:hypothetical protein